MKIKFTAFFLFVISSSLNCLMALDNPTILFIGDSHSYGRFGTVLEKSLSSISDHVIMESSCGSSPSTWLGKTGYEKTVCGFWKKDGTQESRSKEHSTPKLSDELANYRPEVTIVELGTNIAAGSNPLKAAASIEEVMNIIGSASTRCIWIGPPDAHSSIVTKEKLQITNQMLSELASKNNCFYIDSLALTTFPINEKEGIHYPPSLSAVWGEKMSTIIINYLSK